MTGKIDGIFVELKATVDESGVVTGEKRIVASANKIKTEFNKVDKSLSGASKKMGASTKSAAKSMTKMGRSAGQASIQLQQFTGQVSGGVNPLIAFSQQAADLGIVMGAPLLGSIVGIGAAIGVVLLPNVFKSTSALEDLERTTDSLKLSLDDTSGGVLGLSDNLKRLADRSRPLAKLQISASIVDAEEQIQVASDGIIDAVDDMFSSFQGAMSISEAGDMIRRVGGDVDELSKNLEGTKSLSLAGLSSKLDQVARRFGISKESAAGFILAIDELNRTKSPLAVKNLENQLTKLNKETNGSSKRLNELSKATIPLFDAMTSGVDSVNLLRMAWADLNAELNKPAEAKALSEADLLALSLSQHVQLLNAELKGGDDAARRLAAAFELGLTSAEQLPENVRNQLSALEEVEAKTKAMSKAEREELKKTAELKAALKAQEAKEAGERGSNLEKLRAETMAEQELLVSKFETELELLEQSLMAKEILRSEYDQISIARAKQVADEITAIEKSAQSAIASMRMSALSSAVGLLDQFAGKSKKAAVAAILFSKGIALAQNTQSTLVAQMRAMSDLGPIAGPPVAASIGKWGAINSGLIAATGLTQAAGALKGNSSPLTSSGGLPTVNTSSAGAGGGQAVQQIDIAGFDSNKFYSGDQLGSLFAAINTGQSQGYRIAVNGGG